MWISFESSKEYVKKNQWNFAVRRFIWCIQFHALSKYYKHMVFLKCYRYNGALQKHESNDSLTWWRHRLLWHCPWNLTVRYISVICVYSLLWLGGLNVNRSNEDSFTLEKTKSKQYRTGTKTDAEYAEHLALFTNTTFWVESLLHSQEQAAEGMSPNMNANKT